MCFLLLVIAFLGKQRPHAQEGSRSSCGKELASTKIPSLSHLKPSGGSRKADLPSTKLEIPTLAAKTLN